MGPGDQRAGRCRAEAEVRKKCKGQGRDAAALTLDLHFLLLPFLPGLGSHRWTSKGKFLSIKSSRWKDQAGTPVFLTGTERMAQATMGVGIWGSLVLLVSPPLPRGIWAPGSGGWGLDSTVRG